MSRPSRRDRAPPRGPRPRGPQEALGEGRRRETAEPYSHIVKQLCGHEADGYNLVSCASLALLRAAERGGVELPQLSRAVVVHASERQPRPGIEISQYLEALRFALQQAFGIVYRFKFSLETPLTIHARWPYLPLEIGIAWHPILNMPYIPATSLKGALRTAVSKKVCGMDPQMLFGPSPESREEEKEEGCLVVLDAYPEPGKMLQPDVIAPHYREPHQIAEPLASPTPLVFPVVPPETTFHFLVALRRGCAPSQNCCEEIRRALLEALSRGLGAKTAVGYGIFSYKDGDCSP